GPTRVSQHPREDRISSGCTETLPPRPRSATRLEEPETRATPQRRTHPGHRPGIPTPYPPQERHQATTNGLKLKLRNALIAATLTATPRTPRRVPPSNATR